MDNLFTDNVHLKDHLVLFGFEGSALSVRHFLLSNITNMHWHCYSTITKDHVLEKKLYGKECPCVPVCL